MNILEVLAAGPSVTVQDEGRPGWLAHGLSRGGAVDTLALCEGRALLGQCGSVAALEMAGFGGRFRVTADTRIALTGAPMDARIDGSQLVWNASHMLRAGATLEIGGVRQGSYGYLHLGGGIGGAKLLGSVSAHLMAGIGAALKPGDRIEVLPDHGGPVGQILPPEARFAGGEARIVPSLQTPLFPSSELARLQETVFVRDTRANRMGVRMNPEIGTGFAAEGQLSILSEIIVPGDIQMTGDGVPFVLLAECQTTGGYPRIGSVIAPDLPKVAQAGPGARLRFRFITIDEGVAALVRDRDIRKGLAARLRPLIRDPHDIADLLSYTLVSGMVDAKANPFDEGAL